MRDEVILQRGAKKQKIDASLFEYMNTRFILGSSAEAELVFSVDINILFHSRRAMTTQLFETLMFLKFNERFWDTQLVG